MYLFTLLGLSLLLSGCAKNTNQGKKEVIDPESDLIEAITPASQDHEWAKNWWLPRHEAKLKRIKDGDVDLLMIGDSITHGWEGRPKNPKDSKGGKEVWDRYYGHRKAVNLGYGGDRTQNVLWRLQHGEVDGIAPKLAVIMIGTNNTSGLEPAKHTALGIKHIIRELQMRVPETKILLLAIFPRGIGPDDAKRQRNNEVNGIISGYADNEIVFFLNINEHFLDGERTLLIEAMPDLLHPNQKGYQIWAEAMEPKVAELLRDEAVQAEEDCESERGNNKKGTKFCRSSGY